LPLSFRRLLSLKERSHHQDASILTADGTDEQSLLQEIRQQLSQVVAYREEHERLLQSLEERLNQLDGLAERGALRGLVQEGINVLIVQHDLAQEGAQLRAAVAEAEGVEQRLRAAEEALLGHAGDALSTDDGIELSTVPLYPQNDQIVSDAHASVGPALGHRPPRIEIERAPRFADD